MIKREKKTLGHELQYQVSGRSRLYSSRIGAVAAKISKS